MRLYFGNQRRRLFATGLGCAAILGFLLRFFSMNEIPSRIVAGVLGTPAILGYDESFERTAVYIMLVAVFSTAYLLHRLFTARFRKYHGTLLVALGILLACGDGGWEDRFVVLLAIFLVPWSGVLTLLARRTGTRELFKFWRSPDVGYPALLALSFVLLTRMQLCSPWLEGKSASMNAAFSRAYLLGTVAWFVAIWGAVYRGRNFWKTKDQSTSAVDLVCALSPLFPFLRIGFFSAQILFHPEQGLRPVIDAHETALLAALSAVAILSLSFLRRKRLDRVTSWLTAHLAFPLLIYVTFYSPNIFDSTELHEGDVWQFAHSLFDGRMLYRDFFEPHGFGVGWVGAQAMRLLGPTFMSFRFGYLLLSPVAFVLLYYLLSALWGRRHRLEALFASVLAAGLSGLFRSYRTGLISWYSGLKLILPIACFLLLVQFLKRLEKSPLKRHEWRIAFLSAGIASALSLWASIEYGVASIAAILVTLSLGLLRQKAGARQWLSGGAIYGATFIVVTLMVWPVDTLSLIHGLYYHLSVFPARHSQLLGLPLFRPSIDPRWNSLIIESLRSHQYRYMIDQLLAFLPLAVVPLGFVISLGAWRNPSKKNISGLLLLPLTAFSVVLYHIAIGRSDPGHFYSSLGLIGVMAVLILRKTAGRRAVLLASLCFLAGQRWISDELDLRDLWTRKWRAAEAAPGRKIFDPRIEGAYPILSGPDFQMLSQSRDFLKAHPNLGKSALFLTDREFLFKTFFPLKSVNSQTSYLFIVGSEEQQKIVERMRASDTKMVYYSQTPWESVPIYARWPILSEYVHQNYVPCRTFASGVSLLVRKDYQPVCDANLDRDQIANQMMFDSHLGYLPASLGNSADTPRFFAKLGFARFELVGLTGDEVFTQWECVDDRGKTLSGKVAFFLSKQVKTYLVPLTPNPAWSYCRNPPRQVTLFRQKGGDPIGRSIPARLAPLSPRRIASTPND